MSASCFFFFKQKTAYEMRISDWSSDVCSSDLAKNLHYAMTARPPVAGDMLHHRAGLRGDAPQQLAAALLAFRRHHADIAAPGQALAEVMLDLGAGETEEGVVRCLHVDHGQSRHQSADRHQVHVGAARQQAVADRKSTRLNSS